MTPACRVTLRVALQQLVSRVKLPGYVAVSVNQACVLLYRIINKL